MVKLAIISNYYPEIGGMPDYTGNLVKYLSPNLKDLIIISRFNPDYSANKVRSIYKEKRLSSIKKVKETIDDFNPDLVHIQYSTFSFMPFLPLLVSQLKYPKISTSHEVLVAHRKRMYSNAPWYLEPLFKNAIYLYDKTYYRTVDRIIVHTRFLKERLVVSQNINPSRVSLIHHGADVSVIPKSNHKLNKRVLFLGTFTPHKGVETLLQVFHELSYEGTHIELVLVGPLLPGIKRRDAWYSSFKKSIVNSNYKDRIYLTGYLNDKEVGSYMRSSDLIVLPYKEIACSGVVSLAMSYGVPIVASNLGGFKDQIIDGKTGLLFEPNSAEDLKRKILLILKDSELRANLGANARAFAEQYLDWKLIVQKHLSIYHEMCRTD